MLFSVVTVSAQQKKSTPPPPTIKGCHVPSDTSHTNTLSLDDIKAWADSKPLQVQCTGGKMYSLTEFNISIIKHNPMQTLDFGIGNGGIPILARKEIDKMGPMDTILLRDVKAKDETGKDQKLSTIVFKTSDVPAITKDSTAVPAPQNNNNPDQKQ